VTTNVGFISVEQNLKIEASVVVYEYI